jgi:hypothetical protein
MLWMVYGEGDGQAERHSCMEAKKVASLPEVVEADDEAVSVPS